MSINTTWNYKPNLFFPKTYYLVAFAFTIRSHLSSSELACYEKLLAFQTQYYILLFSLRKRSLSSQEKLDGEKDNREN